MRELFESNQEEEFISFYGKFPNGRPMISEYVPGSFKGGLLHRMFEDLSDLNAGLIPIFGSYRNIHGNLFFELIHAPTKTFLSYDSVGTFAGYGGYSNFYKENLRVSANCSDNDFASKLRQLYFLRKRFSDLKKIFSQEIASEEDIRGIREVIKVYDYGEDARMKC